MTEPRFHLTEAFLATVYAAKSGKEQSEAAETVAYFIASFEAMGLITRANLEAKERDAHILDLAGKAVPRATIAFRLSMARSKVFEALRRHQEARRAVLKAG